jgi:hypothetical protein
LILAPQAAPLAHDPRDDEVLSPDPVGVASMDG